LTEHTTRTVSSEEADLQEALVQSLRDSTEAAAATTTISPASGGADIVAQTPPAPENKSAEIVAAEAASKLPAEPESFGDGCRIGEFLFLFIFFLSFQ